MLAHLLEEAERCGLCGTAAWEWEANKRAYVPVEHLCMGCYMKEAMQEESSGLLGTTIRLVASGSVANAKRLIKQRREAARGRRGGDS